MLLPSLFFSLLPEFSLSFTSAFLCYSFSWFRPPSFFSCPPTRSHSRVKTNLFFHGINKPLSLLLFSLPLSLRPFSSGVVKINGPACVYFWKEDLTTAEYRSSHFAIKPPPFPLSGCNRGTRSANLGHATLLANQSHEHLPAADAVAKTEMVRWRRRCIFPCQTF